MTILSALTFKRNEFITYMNDFFVQAENEHQMFEGLRNCHEALGNSKLTAAPDKSFLFRIAVKILGHINTKNKIESLFNNNEIFHQMKRIESKKHIMKLSEASKYFWKYFPKFLVIWAQLYNLLNDDAPFHWSEEQKSVFNKLKQYYGQLCDLILPNTKNTFSKIVDASALGVGTVSVQTEDKDQSPVTSFSSRIFTERNQKINIVYPKQTAIVFSLEIDDFLINGSKHPKIIFTDLKPIDSLLAR